MNAPVGTQVVTRRAWRQPWDVRIALRQHYRILAWQRQDGRCLYCTRRLGLHEVTAEHREPRARGGADVSANIDAACAGCNELKGVFPYQAVLRAIHAPSLQRDGWTLHLVGVEIRVMRAAAQALDRLREALPGPAQRRGRPSSSSLVKSAPPYAQRGEVPRNRGGGVGGGSPGAHDPSVPDYRDTSPASLGRNPEGDASAPPTLAAGRGA